MEPVFLKGDRVHLRKLRLDDFDSVFEYMNDPDVNYYFMERPYTAEKVMNFVNPSTNQEHYAICLNSTNQMIGHLDFHPFFMVHTYEVGWALDKKYHHRGYAFEAARLVMHYAFVDCKAHRVIATCQPTNLPSKRLCEKLNMRLEGTFIQCIYNPHENLWLDELFYAILKDDYFRINKRVE